MFSKSFIVFCSLIPFIWCELTRNDIKISSAPIAGGVIPSNSISLSTATGTKFVPGSGEQKSQNVTLKMPLLSVSVKNSSTDNAESVSNDIQDKITDTLANLVDNKFNRDLLLQPEKMINPEDIMLDLDIPVRVTELEDLSQVSSVEQFKQKMLSSSLLEKLFVDIEDKKKLYPALAKLASMTAERRRRKRATHLLSEFNSGNNEALFNDPLTNTQQLLPHRYPNSIVHRIYKHYPKRTKSEIVYKPNTSRVKIRRNVNQEEYFHPSMRSTMVGRIHHLPPLPHFLPLVPPPLIQAPLPPLLPLIPPPLIRAPYIPHHHPIHHVPRLPPPHHLPVIPPAVLAQILRARARHPLPPLIPLGLLPQIARSIGILPSQLLAPFYSSYPTEDIIIAGRNPIQRQGLQNTVSSRYPFVQRSIQPTHSIPLTSFFEYPISQHKRIIPSNLLLPAEPSFVSDPRSIFDYLPPFRRRKNNNNQQTSLPQLVQLPYWNLPTQPRMSNLQHAPVVHFVHPYDQPSANNVIGHQSTVPMTYTRAPRAIHLNRGDPQEIFESLERTGMVFGNALFSLIGHMPMITR